MQASIKLSITTKALTQIVYLSLYSLSHHDFIAIPKLLIDGVQALLRFGPTLLTKIILRFL